MRVQLLALEHFNWELFDHPHYSPNLAPSDYGLFTYLKNWLRLQCFSSNEELVEGVKTWLSSQAANVFDTGIQKLIPRYIPVVTALGSSLRTIYIRIFCI
jgi:histone-lysine N-methyltransferase SETMAR